MPITLGCPSCGKRFRARDESAGKKVKCPFCQAAVPVPTAQESEAASAGTAEVPAAPASPSGERKPVSAASAEAWGSGSGSELPPIPPPQPARPEPPPFVAPRPAPAVPTRPAPAKPAAKPAKPAADPDSPTGGWRKARGGLGWVLFGLFFFALMGFVPFGKMVYQRAVGDLPKGEGWVKIDGYVNDDTPDAFRTTKTEELNALMYGLPIVLGGLAIVMGRLTAGAAPRNSGAKGLFAFSGLAALVALTAVVSLPVCEKAGYREVYAYARTAAIVCVPLSEFWFLLALGAAGATLKRPGAVRAVGLYALVLGMAAVLIMAGWDAYKQYGTDLGVPKVKDADWLFYEEAAKMLGWLIVVGTYWRAVRAVRAAISDYLASAVHER